MGERLRNCLSAAPILEVGEPSICCRLAVVKVVISVVMRDVTALLLSCSSCWSALPPTARSSDVTVESCKFSVLGGDAGIFISASCWSGNSAITVGHGTTAEKCRPQNRRTMGGAEESIISALMASRHSKMSTGRSVKEAILFPLMDTTPGPYCRQLQGLARVSSKSST